MLLNSAKLAYLYCCYPELAVNFSKYDLDLLGIQEHRIVHEETIRYGSI